MYQNKKQIISLLRNSFSLVQIITALHAMLLSADRLVAFTGICNSKFRMKQNFYFHLKKISFNHQQVACGIPVEMQIFLIHKSY